MGTWGRGYWFTRLLGFFGSILKSSLFVEIVKVEGFCATTPVPLEPVSYTKRQFFDIRLRNSCAMFGSNWVPKFLLISSIASTFVIADR